MIGFVLRNVRKCRIWRTLHHINPGFFIHHHMSKQMSFWWTKWICINNDLSCISKQVSRTLCSICHFSFKQIPLQKGSARSSLWLLKKPNKQTKKRATFLVQTEPRCLHSLSQFLNFSEVFHHGNKNSFASDISCVWKYFFFHCVQSLCGRLRLRWLSVEMSLFVCLWRKPLKS